MTTEKNPPAKELLDQTAKEAIESGRFHGIIAFIDKDGLVQYRMFTDNFPFVDMPKAFNKLREFSLEQIGWQSSKNTF